MFSAERRASRTRGGRSVRNSTILLQEFLLRRPPLACPRDHIVSARPSPMSVPSRQRARSSARAHFWTAAVSHPIAVDSSSPRAPAHCSRFSETWDQRRRRARRRALAQLALDITIRFIFRPRPTSNAARPSRRARARASCRAGRPDAAHRRGRRGAPRANRAALTRKCECEHECLSAGRSRGLFRCGLAKRCAIPANTRNDAAHTRGNAAVGLELHCSG